MTHDFVPLIWQAIGMLGVMAWSLICLRPSNPRKGLEMIDTATTEPENVVAVVPAEAAPTMVVCQPKSLGVVQAALFVGWEYRAATGCPYFGQLVHPDGPRVNLYPFTANVGENATRDDLVAIEGDYMPEWAYRCVGAVTFTPSPRGVVLTVHKYCPDSGALRVWIIDTKSIPCTSNNSGV